MTNAVQRLGSNRRNDTSARTRVLVAVLVGVITGSALGVPVGAVDAVLIGWVVAAATFGAWTWLSIWPQDAAATKADARREDPSRPLADVTCLTAAVASLVAVAFVLVHAGNEQGAAKLLGIALAVASVVAAWMVIHTVFTLKYARQYYGVGGGGISFNQDAPPRYSDFAYIAFTIGMTFQVSDTDLQSNDIRRLALRHMLLSYLMGAVIVAVTINLVAGMTK